jgi:calcineurin-like phosphoesterase family protein
MATWFTSDLHIDHKSILHYTDREKFLKVKMTVSDHELLQRHNQWILDDINSRVAEQDYLYLLGDIYLGANKWKAAYWISQINCRHKILIGGNHDHKLMGFYRDSGLFEQVHEHRCEIRVNGYTMILDHHPLAEWNKGHHGALHCHGHTHGNFDYKAANLHDKRILDVGWDNSVKVLGEYRPFELADIEKYMEGRVSILHHNKAG